MAVAAESAGMGLEPSLEQARALAAQGNVVPVRARFVDDCETPVSAFLKLRAGEEPGAPPASCSSPPSRARSGATRSSASGPARSCAGATER